MQSIVTCLFWKNLFYSALNMKSSSDLPLVQSKEEQNANANIHVLTFLKGFTKDEWVKVKRPEGLFQDAGFATFMDWILWKWIL